MITNNKSLVILHSSDWHLGRSLYNRKRYKEQEAFLNWLTEAIDEHNVDVLLVAGDIFDSGNPGTRAQELYYRFLHRVSASSCRHVVIIAGNHDSAAFLVASKPLLRVLNIHVVGVPGNGQDEVLLLDDSSGEAKLVVCAVPFLRERDLRVSLAGESIEEKEKSSIEGLCKHYKEVIEVAERVRRDSNMHLPLVIMGHLFVSGGQTIDGDGVRDLYVGTLAHVPSAIFPSSIDYVALGHLHIPQVIKGGCDIRYSGSPIPMGFGEAKQQKSVSLITFKGASRENKEIQILPVPVFQKLERIKGDAATIVHRVEELLAEGDLVWLEIVHDGLELISELREQLEQLIAGSRLEILRISSVRLSAQTLNGEETEQLADLDPLEVFQRCLDARNVSEEQRPELLFCYKEILQSLEEGVAKGSDVFSIK